ncbi:hypothetical protein [Wenzhouxiangella sp. EGI_FJ10305]|uniref:hypothetical protein n=1 Tax=Wenzhouxiangella sp. EGI_FJ10305 TaxID=3243768 RepID=UPI0035E0222A
MAELSQDGRENLPISKAEAISIATEATSSSMDAVGRVELGKSVKSLGEVWIYMVEIRSPTSNQFIVVAPNGDVVEPSLVEEGMTAHPDCSNYRFNTDAGKAGAG